MMLMKLVMKTVIVLLLIIVIMIIIIIAKVSEDNDCNTYESMVLWYGNTISFFVDDPDQCVCVCV